MSLKCLVQCTRESTCEIFAFLGRLLTCFSNCRVRLILQKSVCSAGYDTIQCWLQFFGVSSSWGLENRRSHFKLTNTSHVQATAAACFAIAAI